MVPAYVTSYSYVVGGELSVYYCSIKHGKCSKKFNVNGGNDDMFKECSVCHHVADLLATCVQHKDLVVRRLAGLEY